MKYSPSKLKRIETFLKDSGYILRYEKGNFNSGYCILEDKNIIIINKYFTPDIKFQKIIDIIPTLNIDEEAMNAEDKSLFEKILLTSE